MPVDNPNVGFVSETEVSLAGFNREFNGQGINQKCRSLLIDPKCQEIIVLASPSEITKNGIPIDQFEYCIYEDELVHEEKLLSFLQKHCNQLYSFKDWEADQKQ